MSPVSETTVVMARNCSSLLVMDGPPSATSFRRLSRLGASYASAKPKRGRNLTPPEPVLCLQNPQGAPNAEPEEPQRFVLRDPQGYLFRREANSARPAKNGQGSFVT